MTRRLELTSQKILGSGGLIARRLENFETRPQQLEMAEAVHAALTHGHHLMVEAGTGVGKSFGYLVPAILAVTEESARIRRVVVSTHTISLQEQLLTKDLPLLNSVIPREFSAVLAKGRHNYISRRRLKMALRRSRSLFDVPMSEQLEGIRQWAESTLDGSLSDLSFRPAGVVWDEVASDSVNCMGKKCPEYATCFYYRNRRRALNAQILVVNHALYFCDLALRQFGVGVIPEHDAVIFDEAHTIEATAANHLGARISSSQVEYTLNRLYNERLQKGLLHVHKLVPQQQQVDRCRMVADDFFTELGEWLERHPETKGRVRERRLVNDVLSSELLRLKEAIVDYVSRLDNESDRLEMASAAERLGSLAVDIQNWLAQQDAEGTVYWLEQQHSRRHARNITLVSAPIDVHNVLRSQLFDRVRSVIMTSATLSAGPQQSFGFFRRRLGAETAKCVKLGSPFDFRKQSTIVLPRGMPDPNGEPRRFESVAARMIQRYVQRTDGHAFVLCTSYEMLQRLTARLAPWMAEQELAVYSQADGVPRQRMLEQFKRNPRGILFGTDSFWQGVDVPGDALTNVIITKLPFSVPDHPLLQARLESIRRRGGNPFNEYQLPEAIIKLRQGFGRLIRTRSDHGIVVILDPRIREKAYGRFFLEALPDCEVLDEPVDVPEDGDAETARYLAG